MIVIRRVGATLHGRPRVGRGCNPAPTVVIFLLLLAAVQAFAGSGGGAAASFLKVGLAARPAAMGDAYAAVGEDVQAAAWNPGGTAGLNRAQAGLSYAAWLKGMSLQQVTVGLPMGRASMLGVNLQMLSSGALKKAGEDAGGNPDPNVTGDYTAGNLAAGLLYGRQVSEGFFVGAQAKLVQDTIDQSKASGFAADLGALWKNSHVRLGASAVNLGPRLKEESLPSAVRVGGAITPAPGATAALDVVFPGDSSRQKYGFGAEYWVMKSVAVRGGYRYAGDAAANTPTAGIGLNFSGATVDYALAMFGDDLGQTHRVTLAYAFGKMRSPSPAQGSGIKK